MMRSKQERTPWILSACLTRKGCSVVMAATAFSSGRWLVHKTHHHSERERRFPSHFGCGYAAVCEGDQTSPVRAIEQLHHTSRLSIQIERILHVFLQGPHRLNGNDDSGPRTPLDGGPQWLAAFGQLRTVLP